MNRIWILGIGPLMVDKLFLVDVKRVNVYLDDRLMPKNEYIVLEKLYELFGSEYYFYTKYISQRLGNNAFDHLKQQYENKHIICKQYNIYVYKNRVEARMFFSLYDTQLRWVKNIKVDSMIKKSSKSITLINF